MIVEEHVYRNGNENSATISSIDKSDNYFINFKFVIYFAINE